MSTDPQIVVRLPLRTRYAETDMMQYIHHSVYPIYFEAARTELLRSIGISYRALEEQGILLPVMELGVKFFQPAYYDDELHIEARYRPKRRALIRLDYVVWRDAERLAEGFTTHLFVDRQTRRAMKPPQFFWDAVQQALEHLHVAS